MGARNDDPAIDVERDAVEPRFVEKVRGGDSLPDSSVHQGRDTARIGVATQICIERQTEAAQDEKSGFVVRVIGAVPVMQAGRPQSLRDLSYQLL